MNPKKIYELYCDEARLNKVSREHEDIFIKREKEFGPY
jgi:hypothetical protein